MMNKGMFYLLLPLVALMQIGASHARVQVDKDSLMTVKAPVSGVVVKDHGKDSPQVVKPLVRPLSGRNRIAPSDTSNVVRAGRNLRLGMPKKKLERRK